MLLPLNRRWLDDIWCSPYRLRFELNTGGAYVNMFTSAYDRARELARAALPGERPVGVVAAFASARWALAGAGRKASGFTMLRDMGVATRPALAGWRGTYYPPDEGDEACEHRAVSLTWDQADILLWNNIAQEMGVQPCAPVLSKLADPERGIVVNAYDDRGMDVIALSAEPIAHLYERFEGWLLDYDRARMAAVFG